MAFKLRITFTGQCMFVDRTQEAEKDVVVLIPEERTPVDSRLYCCTSAGCVEDRVPPLSRHFAYIVFPDPAGTYAGTLRSRPLSWAEITIDAGNTGAPKVSELTTLPKIEDIIGMTYQVKDTCLADPPNPALVVSRLKLNGGMLTVPRTSPGKWEIGGRPPAHIATYVTWEFNVATPNAKIVIDPYDGGAGDEKEILLQPATGEFRVDVMVQNLSTDLSAYQASDYSFLWYYRLLKDFDADKCEVPEKVEEGDLGSAADDTFCPPVQVP